tara:strand:- start:47428 stop:48711 length:1284 start_codon:yes stop_codon:yes gene_type:complete
MKKKWLLGMMLAPALTFAGGFQLNLQGAKAVGLGGAFTGWANDASSVFFNPGGMTQLSGHNLYLGVQYVTPSVSLQTDLSDNINQTTGSSNPVQFYYVGKLNSEKLDKLRFGMLVNNQFGSSSSFEDSWEGRYIVQNISLKTFMYQPTVAYQLHDKFSIGAGFVYTSGSFSYEKAVPVASSSSDYGKAHLEGSGKATGFNVGAFSTIIDNDELTISAGVNYRSKLKLDLTSGTAQFTDIPSSLEYQFPSETGFTSSLTLPSVFTFGFRVTKHLNEDMDISLVYDYNQTGWSSYDTLSFDFENEDTPDSKTVKNWQNTPTHRIGVALDYKETISVRAGLYIDKTPIEDGYVSPELPDADQTAYTAGFSYKVNDMFTFDFSFIRQSSERTASLDAANFNASYRRKVNVYGVGLNFTFGVTEDASASSIE